MARRPIDEETRAILDAIRRLLRHMRNAASRTHASAGVTVAQLFVLQALEEARTSLSVNELAERTYADQSTLSVVAQRLEDLGLVMRRRSSEDRRRVDLSLTAKARALLKKNLASPQQDLVDGIRRLTPRSRAGLAACMVELLRAMRLDRAPAPMLFEDDARSSRGGRRRRSRK